MPATVQQPRRVLSGASVNYERHRPKQTTLCRLAQQHAGDFFGKTEDAASVPTTRSRRSR